MNAAADDPFLESTYARMQGELRWWAWLFIVLGIFHIAAGLEWWWPLPLGALFVLAGLASLCYFRETAIYPVYVTLLLWAIASSVLINMAGSICVGIGELALVPKLLIDYRRYRRTECAYLARYAQDAGAGPRPCAHAGLAFPWVAAAFGFLALTPRLGLTQVILSIVAAYAPAVEGNLVVVAIGLVVGGLGAMAVALAVAALLGGHRMRPAALAGLAAGGIATALWLQAMMLLAGLLAEKYSR